MPAVPVQALAVVDAVVQAVEVGEVAAAVPPAPMPRCVTVTVADVVVSFVGAEFHVVVARSEGVPYINRYNQS